MWPVPSSSLTLLKKKNQTLSVSSLKTSLKKALVAASSSPTSKVLLDLEQISGRESSSADESATHVSEATQETTITVDDNVPTTCDLDMAEYFLARARRGRAKLGLNEGKLDKSIRDHLRQATVHETGGCHRQAKKCTLNATQNARWSDDVVATGSTAISTSYESYTINRLQ
jgi:hypothetical protein